MAALEPPPIEKKKKSNSYLGYRESCSALNDSGSQLVNVEYTKFPTSIDKSRITSDAQLQLRLVAERLCTRVERRYEKRLLQQREKDRVDTDRKLADIRAEYAEQMEMRRREVCS
ncbi:hypothetical protein OSTOST_22707, partial [Ostertagia ostertagi]